MSALCGTSNGCQDANQAVTEIQVSFIKGDKFWELLLTEQSELRWVSVCALRFQQGDLRPVNWDGRNYFFFFFFKGFCVLSSAFPTGQGASSRSHPRIVPTLLPAGLGDGDGGRDQCETRVSVRNNVAQPHPLLKAATPETGVFQLRFCVNLKLIYV